MTNSGAMSTPEPVPVDSADASCPAARHRGGPPAPAEGDPSTSGEHLYVMVTPAHVLDLQAAYASGEWVLTDHADTTDAANATAQPVVAGTASDAAAASCATLLCDAYAVRCLGA